MTAARDPAAGLSLIEVLVVLAIVGVMAGVTTLGLGALGQGAQGEAEASRLAARLQLAADEAMVSGTPLALVWDERAYRFLQWDGVDRAWKAAELGDLGTLHRLAAGLRLQPEGADGPVLITPDLPQPPVVLPLTDGAGGWRVAFDGFAASTTVGN